MSKKDIKNQNYSKGPPKYENEPEEGEIIDEYDLIVSSDEELSMKQRILELEAENEEIEQIAVISRSYAEKFDNNRAAQVPTDVSSISSTEFVTPQKRKRRRSKERKRKHCHRQHPREYNHQYDQTFRYELQNLSEKTHSKKAHCKRRQKLFAKKHKKHQSDHCTHIDLNAETISLESLEDSDSSSITDADINGYNWFTSNRKEDAFNKRKLITRKTLRMAVERNTNESESIPSKYCLKDKLLRQELVEEPSKKDNSKHVKEHEIYVDNDEDDDVQVIENEAIIQTIDEDSTDSMEEKELRLIALKSAVLKKHMARKVRNAEVAYSPTDFDDMLSSSILHMNNKIDDIDIIDLESEDFQPACGTVSPEASPQLQMLDDQEESQQMVDCKPVDMDIANSDSEDATIDSWSKDIGPSPDSFDFVKNQMIQYGFYIQNLNEVPPPPPGVDDYDDIPPPPPSYQMHFDPDIKDMDVDNEEFTNGQQKIADHEIINSENKEIQHETETTIKTTVYDLKSDAEEDDEEEEEALRALLLSKFHSPKNQKKLSQQKDVSNNDTLNISEINRKNECKRKPTEIILKEAVKRLKIHSKTETHKPEEINVQSNVEENTKSNHKSKEIYENNKVYTFEKLRDRLGLYKCPSDSYTDLSQGNTENFPSEPKEFGSNLHNEVMNEQTAATNTFMVTNTIDISDITRRLQEIKENVLNSTNNIKSKSHLTTSSCDFTPKVRETSHSPRANIETAEMVQEHNEPAIQNVDQLNNQNSNKFVNPEPNVVSNAAITKNKIVETNYDVDTNQTTFKVTIKNNVAVNCEENNIVNTLNDTAKENDNDMPKKLTFKVENASKKDLARNSIIKLKNKVMQPKEPVSTAKSMVTDKISSNTTYPLLRATKIVKPNKIINNNFDLKQIKISKAKETAVKSKSETNGKLTDNLRLITSIDQVKHMCKLSPFIISLQNSSNDSSENEIMEDCSNSLYKPLYEYNDNASPLSLNMESPSTTPLRSTSPINSNTEVGIKKPILAPQNLPKKETAQQGKQIIIDKILNSEKTNKTPLAVRHLPPAAQTEYRKLVHRMKLLENKRKLTIMAENKKENDSKELNNSSITQADDINKEIVNSDSNGALPKNSLVKKVLIKNASNGTTSTTSNKTSKMNKCKVLRSYENMYKKMGEGIVNNLDKSLKLVEEAKTAKIAKLKLENRLKELKAEIDILQRKEIEVQQKIDRTYPSICSTNDIISSLKGKRSKVFKAALNLGKTIKGDVYRLTNDLREIITNKTKKLATEIKTVNSLKAHNIKMIEDLINQNLKEDQEIEKKKIKTIEDCKKNTEEDNKVITEVDKNATTNSDLVCSERCHDNEEELTIREPLSKTDNGGNTEFQKMEADISVSHNNNKNNNTKDSSCSSTNINETCLKTDSEDKKKLLPSYISPLEHLRNIDSNMDPNGVVCPYDLMGNCEDVTCKYVHITPKAKT